MAIVSEGRVIQYDEVTKAKQNLETLMIAAKAASDALKEALTAVADKAGVDEKVLKVYIKAGIQDGQSKAYAQASQLCFLFDAAEDQKERAAGEQANAFIESLRKDKPSA